MFWSVPAARGFVGQSNQVEDTIHAGVDQIPDRGRLIVEPRYRRRQDRAHFRQKGHCLQMPQMERALSDHQNQSPALFEDHVRRPGQQVRRDPACDRRHRMYGAGSDHHAVGAKRPTCQWCRNVVYRPRKMREGLQIRCFFSRFKIKGFFPGAAEDEMNFHVWPAHFFQKPESVNRSARPGDADDYSQMGLQKICFVPNLEQYRIYLIEAGTDR